MGSTGLTELPANLSAPMRRIHPRWIQIPLDLAFQKFPLAFANLAAFGWPETHGDLWNFWLFGFFGDRCHANSQRLNPSYGLHGSLPWLASNDSCGHRKHQPWKHPGCYEIISFSLATWKCHLLQPKRHQKVTPQNQQPEVPTCHHTIYFCVVIEEIGIKHLGWPRFFSDLALNQSPIPRNQYSNPLNTGQICNLGFWVVLF